MSGPDPSETTPEPPSPSTTSRPLPSDSSAPTTPTSPTPCSGLAGFPAGPSHLEAGLAAGPRPLALFEEELPNQQPRVPALLRPMAPYSALGEGESDGEESAGRSLGAPLGVAAPCLQAPLGLLLALRLPWAVGAGGVLQAAAVGALLGACALLTSVSLSAVASNGPAPGGGALGLIGAGLGPEVGGAVGVASFLGSAFAAAAAALGAAELLLVYVLPAPPFPPARGPGAGLSAGRGLGAGLLGLLLLGAGLPGAARVSAPLGPAGLLLALLGLGLGALSPAPPEATPRPPCLQSGAGPCPLAPPPANGSSPAARRLAENLWPRPPDDVDAVGGASFGVLLGLSLPSAGGLLWGCSRCRQLRDPSSSVALGSCGAALGTALGYVGGALLLGAGLERRQLRDEAGQSLRGLGGPGRGPWLPLGGALLSAAGCGLEALLGGSRLLRGLCRARALPLPAALGRGRLLPLAATGLLAALGVLIGSFDLVAPVVSEFWLTSYLGLNLACGLQGLLPPPGWAPQCRCYHWAASLAGAGLCLGLMLVTCWYGALLALAIGATAHQYVQYRRARSAWGEGLRGLSLGAAQVALLRLEDEQPPAASWRPQLLVLVEVEEEQQEVAQPQLLALASHLGVGQGLTVAATLLPGELPQDQPRAERARQTLRSALAACRCRGFVQLLVWPGGRWGGLSAVAQGCGLGALRPNAVLLGWPRGWATAPDPSATARGYVELLRVAGSGGRSLLVAKGTPGDPFTWLPPFGDPPPEGGAPRGNGTGAGAGPSLDVWWVVGDGRLLTLLPRLLRRHPAWRGCPLRLFTVALLEDNSERLRRLLAAVARRRGLGEAQTQVVELHDGAVSAYTAERTLMVEQRAAMAQALRQGVPPSGAEEALGAWTQRGPDPGNVRRMHAAERLNEVIGRCSGGARLVLLDLPPPPPPRPDRPVDTYLEFLEVLTEGLGPVLLVRDGS